MSEVGSGHAQEIEGTVETRVVEALDALQLAWDSLRLVGERERDMRSVDYALRPKAGHTIHISLVQHDYDVSILDPNSSRVIEQRTITPDDEFVADDVHFAKRDITGREVPYIRFTKRVNESRFWELVMTDGLDKLDVTVISPTPFDQHVDQAT